MHQESKPLLVRRFKTFGDGGDVVHKRHDEGGVAALVAHMHAAVGGDAAGAHLLAREFCLGHFGQRVQPLGDLRQGVGRQLQLHRLFTDHVLVGQAHAVGAEHTGQRVHEDLGHTQRIGHQAGMLPTRAAETLQRVARDVVAACHRDFLDGIGHLLHSDVDKTFRHFLGRAA